MCKWSQTPGHHTAEANRQGRLCLQRTLVRLANYDCTIVDLLGKDMHLVDALSRAFLPNDKEDISDSVNVVSVADLTPTELKDLQHVTEQDAQMYKLMATIRAGWPIHRE